MTLTTDVRTLCGRLLALLTRRRRSRSAPALPPAINTYEELNESHLASLERYTSAPHGLPELRDGGHLTFDAHLASLPAATCSVNVHLLMEVFARTYFPGYVAGVEELEREGVDVDALSYECGLEQSAGRQPMTPLTKSVAYLLAHLPAKFDAALADMLIEAAEFARREERLGRGEDPGDLDAAVRSVLAEEVEAVRARLESRGQNPQ